MSGNALLLGVDAAPPAGASQYSLVFNGAGQQYVTCGNVLSIVAHYAGGGATSDDPVTIGVWLKSTQTTFAGLVGRGYISGAQARYGILINDTANGSANGLYNDNSGTTEASANANPNDGSWHLLVWVFGSNASGLANCLLYLDGVQIASVACPGGFVGNENTAGFWMGVFDPSGGNFAGWFTGKLAQPFVYWGILSATQISNLAAGTLDPGTLGANLGAVWYFREGSGTTCADSSGNANDGTLTSGVSWSTDLPSVL